MACHGCHAEQDFPAEVFYFPLGTENDETLIYDVDEQIRILFSQPIDWHEDAALLHMHANLCTFNMFWPNLCGMLILRTRG